jgi:hypothetical protein
MKYIKKPIPVEAFCPAEDTWPEWFKTSKNVVVEWDSNDEIYCVSIQTLEGVMECHGNDYIIQGVDGELYPCRRDIFLKTYEKFEEGN